MTQNSFHSKMQIEMENNHLKAYAHMVAHQLKLPLTGILLTARLLDDECDALSSEDVHRDLRAICSSALKMKDIIDNLLLLGSVEGAQTSRQPIEMQPIVSEVLCRLAPMITEYNAQIRLPQTWPSVLGFRPWIEEIWINYISNALKFGGRPPRIELGVMRQSDGKVCFTVADNGSGISAPEQDQLFQPFRRLGKTRVEGTGLGLSIVRRLTENLQGRVSVESAEGKGSIFGFALDEAPRK